LNKAAEAGHDRIVEILGLDGIVRRATAEGMDPALFSADRGNVTGLTYFVAPENINTQYKKGMTLLINTVDSFRFVV
ncbi:MAG: hypothetical protein WCO09_04930, partial [bacterium]